MHRYDRIIPFNDLPQLPPPEQVENDPEILKKLVQISRALAAVNSNVLRLPNPSMLVNTIAIQEQKLLVLLRIFSQQTMNFTKLYPTKPGKKKQIQLPKRY